jgi:hypothetical protein
MRWRAWERVRIGLSGGCERGLPLASRLFNVHRLMGRQRTRCKPALFSAQEKNEEQKSSGRCAHQLSERAHARRPRLSTTYKHETNKKAVVEPCKRWQHSPSSCRVKWSCWFRPWPILAGSVATPKHALHASTHAERSPSGILL